MSKSFAAILDDVTRAINAMPARVGTCAVNFSKQRFVQQNWHDTTPEPWKPRSRTRRGGERRQSGAILVDSGRLKRSIRVVSADSNRVIIGTDVPYAEIHNEGLDGEVSVRKHSRRSRKGRLHIVKAHKRRVHMPQRRFLGESQALATQLEELMIKELKNAIEK